MQHSAGLVTAEAYGMGVVGVGHVRAMRVAVRAFDVGECQACNF